MPDTKLSGLATLATPDSADLLEVLDVSDTTMAGTGTNKKSPISGLVLAESQVTGLSAALAGKQPLDADLTAIAALADPNADRILFWDDSAGAYAHLEAGSGLTITGTTIAASGGGGLSGLTAGTIPYATGSTAIADAGGLTFAPSSGNPTVRLTHPGTPTSYIGLQNYGYTHELTFSRPGADMTMSSPTYGAVRFGYVSHALLLDPQISDADYGRIQAQGTKGLELFNTGGQGVAVSKTGAGLRCRALSDTSALRTVGRVEGVFSVATDASYRGDLVLSCEGSAGAHEAVRYVDTGSIAQAVTPIANCREAADDAAAAALSPPVPVGGDYRTGSVRKIRVS